jgi:hypothetical protein
LVCEHFKRDARFVEHRAKTYTSLVGHIRLNRSYYHCRACARGHMPWVKELGLTENSLTPAVAEITCIAGVQTSFGKASEITLRKLSGLRLSESTVERTTEATGERIAHLREQRVQFGEPTKWKWQRDAQGRKCGYVSLDATGVRQQGPGGTHAEGRMAYVGMIYRTANTTMFVRRRIKCDIWPVFTNWTRSARSFVARPSTSVGKMLNSRSR